MIPTKKLQTKTQAGALYYALFIALLFATLSGLLILFAYHHIIETDYYELQNKIRLNASSGIQLLHSHDLNDDYDKGKAIDLFGNNRDSVWLKRTEWGIFDVLVSKAFRGKYSNNKVAFVGGQDFVLNESALYMRDQNKPLSLCGNTRIEGDVQIPKAGVQRAYIEGQNYTNDRLIYGVTQYSKPNMPAIDRKRIDRIFDITNYGENIRYEFEADSISNSFQNQTLRYDFSGHAVFDNVYINGNVVISSNRSITIMSSSRLEDILLIAPVIEVRSSVEGSFQAMATDSILINKDVLIQYPSALILKSEKDAINHAFLSIGARSVVKGEMVLLNANPGRQTARITIDKNAVIKGQVYAEAAVQLEGTIIGSIACNKFYLKTPSAIYENHLLNATISKPQLSNHYIPGLLSTSSRSKGIVKWVN